MKRTTLTACLLTAAMLVSGSVLSVSAAEFSSGEAFTEASEAPVLTDGVPEDTVSAFADDTTTPANFDSEAAFAQDVSSPEDTASAEDIPIDEAHFPDGIFRQYLSAPAQDQNQNGILEQSEIEAIKVLGPKQYQLPKVGCPSSLQGVEYLTSLEELTLYLKPSYTELEESHIYLDLAPLTNLKTLRVTPLTAQGYGYVLYHLDLSQNQKLTTLDLSCEVLEIKLPENNQIKDYSCSCWGWENHDDLNHYAHHDDLLLDLIMQMPALEKLSVNSFDYDRAMRIQTYKCPHLKDVTIINSEYGNYLNFENNPELTTLHFEGKLLQQRLDLSNCTALKSISGYLRAGDKPNFLSIIETPFTMFDFGDCHPEKVTLNQYCSYTAPPQLSSAYLELSTFPGWNPDQVWKLTGGRLIGSRLYPDKRDSTVVLYYYLNDANTAPVKCSIEMHHPQPDMVTGIRAAKKTSSSLSITWTPNKDTQYLDGYTVFVYDTATGRRVKQLSVNAKTTKASITGLKAGGRYHIVVRAYRTATWLQQKITYYSPDYEIPSIFYTCPKTPALKASVKSGRRVQLSWKKSPAAYRAGNSGYAIYYRKAGAKSYQQMTQLADSKESFTTKALSKGTYYFRIRSFVRDKDKSKQTVGSFSTIKVIVK